MANTSFGGTAIKKINIGTTQIKHVSVGDKLVYTSAEPFYIVDNFNGKQKLHWKRTAGSNLYDYTSPSEITWEIGQTGVQIYATANVDTQPSSCTFVSDAIDTKGNDTLSYSANVSTHPNNYLIVNGKSYPGSGGTIDISGLSSITLTVQLNAYAYNRPYWQPKELRFY